MSERRRLCEEYVDKWTGTTKVVKKVVRRVHEAPVERSRLDWDYGVVLGGDLLGFHSSSRPGCTNFIRVPSAASQRPVERWTIPQLRFAALYFTVYPPENLLALVEQREQ